VRSGASAVIVASKVTIRAASGRLNQRRHLGLSKYLAAKCDGVVHKIKQSAQYILWAARTIRITERAEADLKSLPRGLARSAAADGGFIRSS
jgi:hypothetical protein